MLSQLFLTIIISIAGSNNSHASFNDTLITGTWKGTSICQKKDSPCHDEIAVCHVTKTGKPGVYQFVMNKIVNGTEEDMGVLDYTYDATANTLTHIDEGRNGIWKFKVNGNTMDGTLYVKGELYRIIKLTKEK
jgi:hypothetical protein